MSDFTHTWIGQIPVLVGDIIMEVARRILAREPVPEDADDLMINGISGEPGKIEISYKGRTLGCITLFQRVNENGSLTVGYEFTPQPIEIPNCKIYRERISQWN